MTLRDDFRTMASRDGRHLLVLNQARHAVAEGLKAYGLAGDFSLPSLKGTALSRPDELRLGQTHERRWAGDAAKLDRWDLNGDGQSSPEEAALAFARSLDRNGDGRLSAHEANRKQVARHLEAFVEGALRHQDRWVPGT